MSYWNSIATLFQHVFGDVEENYEELEIDYSRARLALAEEGLEKIVFMLDATQSNPVCLAIATHYLEMIQDDM